MPANVISNETGKQPGGKRKPRFRKPPYWVKWAGYLALASIFTTALVVVESPVLIHLSFVLAALSIGWMTFIMRGSIGKKFLFAVFFVLVHGLIGVALNTTAFNLLMRVFAGSFLFYLAFSMVIRSFRHNIDDLVRMYVICSLIVAVIGLFQAASFLAGFQPGYDFSWFLNQWAFAPGGVFGIRLNSILFEPSQVAFTMGPAIALSLYRILGIGPRLFSWPAAIVILVFGLLSSSATVLVVIAVALMLAVKISTGKTMLIGVVGLVMISAIIDSLYLEASMLKLIGLRDLFTQGASADSADAGTYTLFVHFKVAIENFVQTKGLGGGLGAHEHIFWKYGEVFSDKIEIYNINTAGNITFRLVSELGVFGLAIIGAYFYYAIVGILRLPVKQRLLHAALIAGISAFLVRNGTYAHFGLAFYTILLIVNYEDGLRHSKYLKNTSHRPNN